MSAVVVPFPSVRRTMVARNALRLAGLRDPERNILSLLAKTRQAHERKGIPAERIEQDLRDMEASLRGHVERARLLEGGVA